MAKKISHLDEQQIIEAVLDQSGLDEGLRRHLFECSACRSEKEALRGRLERFGQISREEAPAHFRKPRMSEQGAGVFKPVWRIRPSLGMAVAFASILLLLLSPLTIKRDRIYTLDMVYKEMLQDEKFMTEVEKLEENPLPHIYVDIADPGDDDKDIQHPGAMKDDGLTHAGGSGNV
ncbi:MAG: hypothetical protein ABSG91_00055 [Syntrophobacteraceae bacterium]